jgi:hypothetical protein
MTFKELMDFWLDNDEFDNDTEIWVETGKGLSSEAIKLYRLNAKDILIVTRKYQ